VGESFTASVQNGLTIQRVSPGCKAARAWRKPFSAQVQERVELCIPLVVPSRHVIEGILLFLISVFSAS
jgi:hypothetical protein